jgi:putative endonuclease
VLDYSAIICHPELVSGSRKVNMSKEYFIYIITNSNNTTFYIGVTNNLIRRIFEHKKGKVDGFSKKYKLKKLIYFESCKEIESAIAREKQLKNWHRDWKINFVRENNPEFKDLYSEII